MPQSESQCTKWYATDSVQEVIQMDKSGIIINAVCSLQRLANKIILAVSWPFALEQALPGLKVTVTRVRKAVKGVAVSRSPVEHLLKT